MANATQNSSKAPAANRLATFNFGLGLLLVGGLGIAFIESDSQLALASMVDSFVDVIVAGALVWALRIADQPPDIDHPAGHQAAEPIAALIVAVLAGIMGVEVIHNAVDTVLSDQSPRLTDLVAGALATKLVLKFFVAAWCWQVMQRSGPAVRALFVDARNDILAGILAMAGYLMARYGWPGWDAWLAIPIGAWIIASGFGLARENMRLLMGEVASLERHESLMRLVQAVPGVISGHELVARHHGTHLDVVVHVVVDPDLPLRDAHDIGHQAYIRLMNEPDVAAANVHLDVE